MEQMRYNMLIKVDFDTFKQSLASCIPLFLVIMLN